jgi:hypothetical protein
LQAASHDLRDQGASGGALHELAQLGGAIMGEGLVLCSVWSFSWSSVKPSGGWVKPSGQLS